MRIIQCERDCGSKRLILAKVDELKESRLTLLRNRFEAIIATSSQVRLLTSKSRVRRG